MYPPNSQSTKNHLLVSDVRQGKNYLNLTVFFFFLKFLYILATRKPSYLTDIFFINLCYVCTVVDNRAVAMTFVELLGLFYYVCLIQRSLY